MVAKNKAKTGKVALDTQSFICRSAKTFTPTQGISTSNYINMNFGIWSEAMNATEFNIQRLRYEQFRVNSMIVQLIPKATQSSIEVAIGATADSVTVYGDNTLHSMISRDSVPPGQVAACTRSPSYMHKPITQRFTRKYTVKYPPGMWFDCQSPSSYNADIRHSLGLDGYVNFYGENLPEISGTIWNQPYYTAIVYIAVVFRNRRPASVSIDASGNIVEKIDGYLTTPSAVPSSQSGTLNDYRLVDVSGMTTAPISDTAAP